MQDCEINGIAVNPANGNTTVGKTGLMRCRDRDTRELVREQQIQSGTFMGLVRLYESGRLVKEYSVNARGNMSAVLTSNCKRSMYGSWLPSGSTAK